MEKYEDKEQRHLKSGGHLYTFTPNEDDVSRLVATLMHEIDWLDSIVNARINELNNPEAEPLVFSQMALPPLADMHNPYTQLVKSMGLGAAERLLLVCSVVTHVSPELLTQKLRDEAHHSKLKYPEFGGYIERAFGHYTPTMQTVLFLLSGNDKISAAYYKLAINRHGKLVNEGIVRFNPMNMGVDEHNELQYIPALAQEYLYYFQSGVKPRPDFGRAFPATWISTGLDWDQLVLDVRAYEQVKEIMRWVEHGPALAAASNMFNISYPCLFYGPPGTGKSLTAKLIGKKYKKDVFRVDLSMIVSKYVGETEKNLAHLFDRAENKEWILFFDEADSLFSKRTSVGNANDKWANLEVSYLLQRMEEYRGLTILATNLKDNLDPAMTRRFQAMIYFAPPGHDERVLLWRSLLPAPFQYEDNINLDKLAVYELSGANIANIIKDSCLCALDHGSQVLQPHWITASIKKEFIKEKRTP